jgi:conjugal transfer pilus assembly protein TraB
MAKNIFPIIEVDAGRKVDFVMIRGMSLNPKPKSVQGTNLQDGVRSANNIYNGNQNGYGGNVMGSNGGRHSGMTGFGDEYGVGSRGAYSGYGR